MFKIRMIYRIICLLAYVIVIFFIKSDITLVFLGIFFLTISFINRNSINKIFYLLSILFLLISFLNKDSIGFKVFLIIDYIYYFINYDYHYLYKIDKIESEREVDYKIDEETYYRFGSNKKILRETWYVTIHLTILLLSIMVG